MVRLAGPRYKYVIVYFCHVTRKGGVMFEEVILHRIFVYIRRSEDLIFGIVLVCQNTIKRLKLY